MTTITTSDGEWLARDLVARLARDVDDIRGELAELQDRFASVMRDVRALPGGEMVWQRIDAYPGIRLDRDMGAGQDADGWLGEVAEFLESAEVDDDLGAHAHSESGDAIRADRSEREALARERDIERARALRARGESLYAIATATGRSKEWLRTNAGISD